MTDVFALALRQLGPRCVRGRATQSPTIRVPLGARLMTMRLIAPGGWHRNVAKILWSPEWDAGRKSQRPPSTGSLSAQFFTFLRIEFVWTSLRSLLLGLWLWKSGLGGGVSTEGDLFRRLTPQHKMYSAIATAATGVGRWRGHGDPSK